MIIDCHCHAWRGEPSGAPAVGWGSLGRYLRRSERAGIRRTVLFAPFHRDYFRANREVARLVRALPDRFYGFAFVHAQRDGGRIGPMVEEAVRRHGFRGIKVHRRDARITREVCEAARAFSVPVLYDILGEADVAERIAREFPDVPFIIPHLGSFADDARAQVRFIDRLARQPNLFADTSGVRHFDLLVDAVRRAGPDKILFGSDGPWLHPELELLKIRLLGLSAEAERLILGVNFLRLAGRAARRGLRLDACRRSACSTPASPRATAAGGGR